MLLYNLWLKCLNKFKNNLSKYEFSMWILPLQVVADNNSLNIYAPNIFVINYVKNNYLNNILKYFSFFCKNLPLINFYVGNIYDKNNIFLKNKKINNFKKNNNYILFKEYKFSNFIYSKSNFIAYKETINLCNFFFKGSKLLFLYSYSGLGKTHLINSIGNEINSIYKKEKKIIYINTERFVNNMMFFISNNNLEKFKYYFKSADVLLMDDIQYLVYNKYVQEEFIYILDYLLKKNCLLVFTCDKNIKKINLHSRIISRLSCGLSIKINKIDYYIKYKFLCLNTKIMNFFLDNKIIVFISKLDFNNIYELKGVLNFLFMKAKNLNCLNNITIDFVKNILYNFLNIKKNDIIINIVKRIVSYYFNIKVINLLSKSRCKSFVYPRQMSIAISRKFTNCSLYKLGIYFGGLDHSTVLYSCRKIKKLCIINNNIRFDYNNLTKLVLMSKYEILYKKKMYI